MHFLEKLLSGTTCRTHYVQSNMGSRMGLIGWLVIMVAILLLRAASLPATTAETVYTVGDSLGWAVPPNTSYYSTWATTNLQTFKLGDELEFNTSRATGKQDVMEVSKADYDNCTKEISINFVIESDSVLKYGPGTAGPHYLICTVDDNCERGQKFSFNVTGPTSSASSLSVGALFAVLSTTLIYFFS